MRLRQPATVHVCALRHVPEMAKRIGARHLVSSINAELLPDTPAMILPDRHLKLDMHDIAMAQPGYAHPSSEHVVELLNFVENWDRQAPMLIHCFAGLSRSTAAAFIVLCAMNPLTSEKRIACALRQSSDTAVPNRLFVVLAERLLGRDGRMVEAVMSMGPNRPALECTPFGVKALHGPGDNRPAHQAA